MCRNCQLLEIALLLRGGDEDVEESHKQRECVSSGVAAVEAVRENRGEEINSIPPLAPVAVLAEEMDMEMDKRKGGGEIRGRIGQRG